MDQKQIMRKEKTMSNKTYHKGIKEITDQLFLGLDPIDEGKMFGYPGYYINRKLVCTVFEDSVCLKLPLKRVESLVNEPGISQYMAMGNRRMKEWILIKRPNPKDYLKDKKLFLEAHAYVLSLTT